MVEKGAWEFEETEKFLATAEQLVSLSGGGGSRKEMMFMKITPYCWGRYDLLLLPPSFPYGRAFVGAQCDADLHSRRHGKSLSHVCDTDPLGRGSFVGGCRG